MKVGLIGLGIMGKPMAKNILKAGYKLMVNDFCKPNVDEVVKCGAVAAGKDQIGQLCDIVITMLPDSPQVKEVMLGSQGVGMYMRPGTIFIDMSSINPIVSREIAEELGEKRIEMLDAPVSGGEPKAIDGTLSIMVGGKQEIFERCRPLLETMGTSIVLCGGIGAGNITKLANQVIVACNIQALSEAFILAKMAGVKPELVFQAIKGGLAGSAVMDAKAPMMLEENVHPGFKIDLHIKDLNNALACAHSVGAPLPMTAAIQEILHWLHNNGYGQEDHSSIIRYYKKLSDVKTL